MNPFFSYFNQQRKPNSRHFYGPQQIDYKRYSGKQLIQLDEPKDLTLSISDCIKNRHSATADTSVLPISKTELSSILYWGAGEMDAETRRRAYPSGGAKYPLEVYVYTPAVTGVEPGLYHYAVNEHGLEILMDKIEIDQERIRQALSFNKNSEVVEQSSAILLFSFIKERGVYKYGHFAYKLGLLEAGHISQNVYLVSSALGIQCRALGGFAEENMHKDLNLDGYNETLFYGISLWGSEKDEKIASD